MSRDALGWTSADYDALVAVCGRLSVSPMWLGQVLYSESGMNPKSLNAIGYRGINQIGHQELERMGLSEAQIAAFTTWTPAQQLKYVERYFRIWFPPGGYVSRAQLYQTNFLPSTVAFKGSAPTVVLARKPSAIFAANAALSTDGKVITVGDLDTRIEARIREPNTRWPTAQAGIEEAAGRLATVATGVPGVVPVTHTVSEPSATSSVLAYITVGALFVGGAYYILSSDST